MNNETNDFLEFTDRELLMACKGCCQFMKIAFTRIGDRSALATVDKLQAAVRSHELRKLRKSGKAA